MDHASIEQHYMGAIGILILFGARRIVEVVLDVG